MERDDKKRNETEERVEPNHLTLANINLADVDPILSTGNGYSRVVRCENEPEWMLEFHEAFKMPMQTWGADLSDDFDDLIYYQNHSIKPARSWDEVPEN